MKNLAIIPARKGSKGLPGKNKKILAGKPLVAYSIEVALEIENLDIIVASDDDDILDLAKSYGIDTSYRRPERVSTDEASTSDLVVNVIDWLAAKAHDYSRLLILQPTSPLRIAKDIELGLQKAGALEDRAVVGVSEPWSHPAEIVFIDENDNVTPILTQDSKTRRQDYLDQYYFINGAFYSFCMNRVYKERRIDAKNFIPLRMDSINSIDIDTLKDFVMAEAILKMKLEKSR